jgi:hypothetical protein
VAIARVSDSRDRNAREASARGGAWSAPTRRGLPTSAIRWFRASAASRRDDESERPRRRGWRSDAWHSARPGLPARVIPWSPKGLSAPDPLGRSLLRNAIVAQPAWVRRTGVLLGNSQAAHGARYRFCIGNARRRTASAPCPACRVGGSLTLIAQRELARRTARTAGPSRALWYLVRKSSNDACPVSRGGIPHHPLWTIRRARSRLGYRMVTTGAPRALRRHTKQVMPRGRRGVTMTRLPTVGRNELRLIRVGRFPRCYTLNAPLVLGAALAPAFVGTFVGLVRSSPAGPGRPRSRDSAPSSPSRWDCCRPPSSRRRSRTGVSDPDGSVAPPPADVGVSGEVTR